MAVKISDVMATLIQIHGEYGDIPMSLSLDGIDAVPMRAIGVARLKTIGRSVLFSSTRTPEKCEGCEVCRDGQLH